VERAVNALCDLPVNSIGGFFEREQLIGEIRCMNNLKNVLEDHAIELENELKRSQAEETTP